MQCFARETIIVGVCIWDAAISVALGCRIHFLFRSLTLHAVMMLIDIPLFSICHLVVVFVHQ